MWSREVIVVDENRSWSLAELRYAIWLGYGGRSPEHPSITRFASAVGVSARTVGRWLSGVSRPDPLRARTIRAALAPPAEVLSRQERERGATVVAAKELARSRPTMASRPWRKAGWDQPHVCWLLHHEHLGIERVMVTKARPVHGTDIPSGWTLVDPGHSPEQAPGDPDQTRRP